MQVSAGVLCLASNGDWRSRSWIFFFEFESSRIRLAAWAVSYFTDQLMTPCFSGGSTINGTPGGDRWARVLGGQIGWLTEPLHRVDADCSGPTNLKMQTRGKHEKIRPTQNTPRNPQQPGVRDHLETARDETSRALAHTRPLPWILGLWKSISYSSRKQ